MKLTDDIYFKLTKEMLVTIINQQAEKAKILFTLNENNELVEAEDRDHFDNYLKELDADKDNKGSNAKAKLRTIMNEYSKVLDEMCVQSERVRELEDVVS